LILKFVSKKKETWIFVFKEIKSWSWSTTS
jgi:hypothetical protein